MLASSTIPVVDLSPFTKQVADHDGRKKAIETITRASIDHGFFQIVNHGLPIDLIAQALEVSKEFFKQPQGEKLSLSSASPFPVGYGRQPITSSDKNEFFLMFSPDQLNIPNAYPPNPPQFRQVVEELFSYFGKIGLLVESLLEECLGLPPNSLREFNSDRSCDFMSAKHYFPATSDGDNLGISEHEDGNCFTFVIQDDVGGLEVKGNGGWVPVTPEEGKIVVNIGDVIQVLSNNKFKSATHRVLRSQGRIRYSYAFFHNLPGEKWIEPLPQFTKDIGELPKYRGFMYKEYQMLRFRNKTHPPSRPQDVIDIRHYALTTTT